MRSIFSKQLKEIGKKNQGQVGTISEKLKKFGVHYRCIPQSTADDQYFRVFIRVGKKGNLLRLSELSLKF